MDEEAEEPTELDPMAHIQNAIAESYGGDGSLLVGFVVVAEWIEADGSTSMTVTHPPMPPWHMHGMLTFARSWCHSGGMAYASYEPDDEDDDDF